MKEKMKKFGAWLIAAALAFAGAGAAMAETVMTESDLTAAITAGGTVTLGADISLSQEVEVGTTVTLDLSTYRVTATAGANAFQVVSNGNFTINADATNPGGITTDDDRCCVYTSYGWHPGQKSVTINGGSFFGNFVFNWSPDIDARAAAEYGLTQGGGGSGSKADPTVVVINGGTFDGGANDGNVAEYRCYYFTVNGGTFEKGLDCADTETCSIGVTSTCKAFFKGGKYRIRYPYWRETSSGRESPAKVVIGDGYTDYVHIIDGDYYAIAPDASGCVQESRYACSVAVYSPIVHFVRQVWQHWTFETKTWYVKQSPDSSNLANGVSTSAPLRLMKTAVPNKLASASPLLAAQPSPQLLSESSAKSEPTVYVNTENGLHEVFLKTYEEVTSAFGEKVKNTTAGHKTRFIDEKDISYDLEQSDFDAAYVFEYDTGIDVLEIVSLVDGYTGKPVDDEARVKLRQMLSLSDDSTDDQIAIAVMEALQAATSGSAPSPYANDPYLEWKTDFVMSFDKPVNAGTVRFLHDRDVSGDASEIFDNPALEAGAYATVFDYSILQPTWGGVVGNQQYNDQLIGLRNLSEDNYGTTVTVALRHISPDGDHSKDVIRASYSYTFPEPPARIVNVTTTAEAQAALDAAKKGDTIVFAEGDYGTIYIRNNGEDANRILENVTLVAAEGAGVTVDEFYHQQVSGKSLDIENLVIDGFSFDDPTVPAMSFDVNGNSSTSGGLRVNGLTVKNCTKVGNNAKSAAPGQSSYNEPCFVVFHYDSATPPTVYAGDPSLECGYHNIQILSNDITQVYMPIAFLNSGILDGLTVVGNTFTDCTDNHIQKSGDQTFGEFIIKDNVIVNMTGRFARISGATADATFTIENNTVTTPKKYDAGGDPDIFKITGTSGFTVTENDNQWLAGSYSSDGATWIAAGDPSLLPVKVAKIAETGKEYPTLQAAFEAAGTAKNVTIELLSNVDLKDVEWPSIHFNGTFDGKGYTISNLKIAYNQEHSGFIRYSDNGAVVKDVTFKDSTVTGNRASVVIGYGYGCTAEDVTVDGAVITGVQKCGGIIGLVGEGAPLTITGCTVKNLKFVYADLEKDGNGGTSFGGLAGFVQYGVNAVITDNKVSGISFVGALDEATFEKYYGSIQDNEKYYQLTCHPFIAAVMGTVDQGVTTPVSVTLADNEVEQVSGLLIGPTTTEYMGFYYREGWTTRRVVDITVDGVLMPNRAVAQIGEAKYYSYAEAFSDAQDGGEIKIVASSVETPSNAFELQMKGDVTLVADEPMTATIAPLSYTSTVDNDGMAYIRSVSDAERKTLTIGENVTLAFPANAAANGAMYIGYSSSTPADVVVNGRIEAYLPYVGSLSTLTVNPSGSIKSISEDLIVRWGAKVDIIGTDADWSEAKPQGRFGYVEQQGGVVTLTDTFVNGGAWWNVTDRNGKYADYPIALVLDGSTVSVSGAFKLAANTTVEMDAYSQIRAASVSNAGSINIVATGIADPVKVIDYTGKTAMTLDDYGTVNVTGGEAYVEDNDLWVKPPVVPPEVDVKDDSGDPEVKDAEGEEIPEEKKADAKQVADDVKTEVTQTLTEPEVAKFEGTGVAEAATETKQAGEEQQIIEVKPEVVAKLQEEAEKKEETKDAKDQITKDSKVESRVEIVFNALEVKVDTAAEVVKATETSVQYDVKPKVKTTVITTVGEQTEEKVVETVIPNEVIKGNPIKFRLAVDSTFGDFARVKHTGTGDNDGNFIEEYLAEVFTANDASGKKFVELSSDHFSTFKLTSTSETPVCRVDNKNYTSLAEAIEKGGATAEIVLLANIELTEDVTLGYNQTIDPGEFAISGAGEVKAAEGYVVRNVNGKSVVYAKPTEVTVTGEQKIAVCIEPSVLTELGGKDALGNAQANGFQVWQNYVMGVDGTIAGNKLVPICKPNAENPGAAAVTITTPMTFGAAPAKTGIAVTYQLLKSATPKSGFTMVGEEQTVPVFAVDTSAEENATYWKIQAIFTPDAN